MTDKISQAARIAEAYIVGALRREPVIHIPDHTYRNKETHHPQETQRDIGEVTEFLVAEAIKHLEDRQAGGGNMDCNKLFTWLVDYEIHWLDGTVDESGVCRMPDPDNRYGKLPRVAVRARNISQAARIAEACIVGALRREPDIASVVIYDIGMVADE